MSFPKVDRHDLPQEWLLVHRRQVERALSVVKKAIGRMVRFFSRRPSDLHPMSAACPSDVDNGTKRYKSSASTANSTPSVTCYKCQQPGHYSAACPDSGKPTTSTVSSSGLTSGSCFKCGEEGHWSSNCPNDGAPNKPTSSARTSTVTRKGRGQGTKVSTSTKRGRGKKKSVFGAPDF